MFHSMALEQRSLDIEFIFRSRDIPSFDSSAGRAEDCIGVTVILRSLVPIRLGGIFFSFFFTTPS